MRPAVPLADPIHQHPHLHAARAGRRECRDELPTDRIGLEDVGREPDAVTRRRDCSQHARERHLTRVERFERIAAEQRQCGELIAGAFERGEMPAAAAARRRRIRCRGAAHRIGLRARRTVGAHAIDAEQPVQHRAAQWKQPAHRYPADDAARIRLGEQRVQRRRGRAAEVHDDEQTACERDGTPRAHLSRSRPAHLRDG